MLCRDCAENKQMRGSYVCESCFDEMNRQMITKTRDVETYNEDRNKFLARRSKELGLNHTAKDIRGMIRAGMTDNLILKTKDENVWTMGSERSRALPMTYHQMRL